PLWVVDATYRGSLFAPSTTKLFACPSSPNFPHLIACVGRTCTFPRPNVYVSRVKRIRFERETYTFCPRRVYVLPPQPSPAPPEDDGQPVCNPYLRRELRGCATCPVPLQTQGLYRTFG
ncbi:hypothetical protein, partial [Porphyromonas sp. oral taxon 278]|uniref:hypothetical protein n=1 Tax=Porphyromonas sp. oral taxon 278 TaxID=712437 RepID=UPI001E54355F